MNKADLFLEVWINTNFQYLRIRQPITCVLILDIGIESANRLNQRGNYSRSWSAFITAKFSI